MRRAAILIALAVLAEVSSYLYGKLELVGFDESVKELTG
jgi:phage-related holin